LSGQYRLSALLIDHLTPSQVFSAAVKTFLINWPHAEALRLG